jgi:hypothetical protein
MLLVKPPTYIFGESALAEEATSAVRFAFTSAVGDVERDLAITLHPRDFVAVNHNRAQ